MTGASSIFCAGRLRQATFFAGGKSMETHPERMAQLLANSNFEIGSPPGSRHLDMARLKGEALKDKSRSPKRPTAGRGRA